MNSCNLQSGLLPHLGPYFFAGFFSIPKVLHTFMKSSFTFSFEKIKIHPYLDSDFPVHTVLTLFPDSDEMATR